MDAEAQKFIDPPPNLVSIHIHRSASKLSVFSQNKIELAAINHCPHSSRPCWKFVMVSGWLPNQKSSTQSRHPQGKTPLHCPTISSPEHRLGKNVCQDFVCMLALCAGVRKVTVIAKMNNMKHNKLEIRWTRNR
ncbi:hypothetical protein D8674_035319 [Pyrus ussuriensis x Pyrus communis]|uniref:Uncharacterized protein n=1 Tax=Pyrus ussuriensis x Pyrus communis TaxID=2448454 RepID=A0A5N5GCX6_9ROSA|nr:hypothetical protein D8674_035319 [Pyrus ussuriensis x Pyrus communis]